MENSEPKKLTVDDYSEIQLEAFQKQFRPMAEKHNTRADLAHKIFYIAGICWIAIFILVFFVAKNSRWPLFVAIPFLVAFLIGALIEGAFLMHCPACEHNLRRIRGAFCPHCGNKSMRRGLVVVPRCPSCHMAFSGGTPGHKHRILFCNSCGIPLHGK